MMRNAKTNTQKHFLFTVYPAAKEGAFSGPQAGSPAFLGPGESKIMWWIHPIFVPVLQHLL